MGTVWLGTMEQLKPKLLYWFPVEFFKMQIFPLFTYVF